MKKTITLKTIENWINKQFDLPSKKSDNWIDGYDSALSDLQIQIGIWSQRRKVK